MSVVSLTVNAIHYEIRPADDTALIPHSRIVRLGDRPKAEQFIANLVQQNAHQKNALVGLVGRDVSGGATLEQSLVDGLLGKALILTRGATATGGSASRPPTATPRVPAPDGNDLIDGSQILSASMKAYLKQTHAETPAISQAGGGNQPDSELTANTATQPARSDYEAVIEIAGQHLSKKQSLQVLTGTGQSHKKYPANDTGQKHRSLVRFQNLDNSPVRLSLAIPMKGSAQPMLLPLHDQIRVHEKGNNKPLWDNVLVPVKPLQFLTTEQQKDRADLLQNGWLYLFWNGKLWRELKVSENGRLQDVDLARYRPAKADKRPAEGHWLDAIWVPYRLNGEPQTQLLFAASALQWSWSVIQAFEADPASCQQNCATVESLQGYQAHAEFDEEPTQSGAIKKASLASMASQHLLERQQKQGIAVAYLPKVGAELRIRLKDDLGNILSNIDFDLDLGGERVSAKTDANGLLVVAIPAELTQSRLHFYRKDKAVTVQDFALQLNELPPADTVKGLQARLNNLGFVAGPVDGISGRKTRAATRAFQARHDLLIDGISGPQTQNRLIEEHQS